MEGNTRVRGGGVHLGQGSGGGGRMACEGFGGPGQGRVRASIASRRGVRTRCRGDSVGVRPGTTNGQNWLSGAGGTRSASGSLLWVTARIARFGHHDGHTAGRHVRQDLNHVPHQIIGALTRISDHDPALVTPDSR